MPPPRPYGLLAELTYRCPLHCPYCSNPTNYSPSSGELTQEHWTRVLSEAAELGVMHVLFSGGEPLLRPELCALVAHAREEGLYTNLITSAICFTSERAAALKAAGLDSIQISFQAADGALADSIAGAITHRRKLEAAQLARDTGIPLSVNVVLHRSNIAQTAEMIALAESLGAERIELANTQYYGWAFANRAGLMPTRAQVDAAAGAAADAAERLRGKMQVVYVMPDYFEDRPKPCMNGWGQRYITVNPSGDVLPCPTAFEITGMQFANVRRESLRSIWESSEAFNRFRGTEWMAEPCRSCELREIDFGGCRCQAALLTGNATNTDPVCSLSPHHRLVADLVGEAQHRADSDPTKSLQHLQYRQNPRAIHP